MHSEHELRIGSHYPLLPFLSQGDSRGSAARGGKEDGAAVSNYSAVLTAHCSAVLTAYYSAVLAAYCAALLAAHYSKVLIAHCPLLTYQ